MALADVPMAAKVGGGVAGAGAVGGGLAVAGTDVRGWLLVIMICAAIVALLFGAYLLFVMWSEKRKGKEVSRGVLGSAARRGSARGKDVRSIAEEANLGEKLKAGVEKIESTGQSLYKMPWYLVVGPPGSGKTEAIRHSELKFPAGITNKMQGAGGTSGMSWWFTSEAVLLDTAGKLLMGGDAEDAGDDEGSDDGSWVYFLKMLRKARPKCPINGMLLAIDCRRLLADDQKKIDRDASKIARQLEIVQRTLNVRFPVYVVVTMGDLLPGFREFFKGISDPKLEQQMLGWSNPAALDTVFDPRELEDHFAEIRVRLIEERDRLLLNPVHTEDPSGRRVDEVDALFKFPNQIEKILPRLQGWLDIIFTPGEWSPKPLFLRGVYFNSAMQEGKDLDEAIARALNKDLAEVAAERDVFRRDKSYFIKDLFRQKVFKERGLVTDARSVSAAQRTGRIVMVASCLVIFALLFGAAWWASSDLKSRIGDRARFWEAVGRVANPALATDAVGLADSSGYYVGGAKLDGIPGVETRADLVGRAFEQASAEISPNAISRILAPGMGSDVLRGERVAAYEQVVARSVGPLIDRARAEFDRLEKAKVWAQPERAKAARDALAEIIRLQSLSAGLKPESGSGPVDVLVLAEFVDGANLRDEDRKALKGLQESLASGFTGTAPWPAWPPRAIADEANKYLSSGRFGAVVKNFTERGLGAGGGSAVQTLSALRDAVRVVADAEKPLLAVQWPGEMGAERSVVAFVEAGKKWREAFGAGKNAGLAPAAAALAAQLKGASAQLGVDALQALLRAETRAAALAQARKSIDEVRRHLPAAPAPGEAPAEGSASAEPASDSAKAVLEAAKLLDDARARLSPKPTAIGGGAPGSGATLEAVLSELDAQAGAGGWLAVGEPDAQGNRPFALDARLAMYTDLSNQLTLILGDPVEGAVRLLDQARPADEEIRKADAAWVNQEPGKDAPSRLQMHEDRLAQLVSDRRQAVDRLSAGASGAGTPASGSGAAGGWADRLKAAWTAVQLRETTDLVEVALKKFGENAGALQGPGAPVANEGRDAASPLGRALGLPMLDKARVNAARTGLARWDRADSRALLRDVAYLDARLDAKAGRAGAGGGAGALLQVGRPPAELDASLDDRRIINSFADEAYRFWLTELPAALVPGGGAWNDLRARAGNEFVSPFDSPAPINKALRAAGDSLLRQAGLIAWLCQGARGGAAVTNPATTAASRIAAIAGGLEAPVQGENVDAFSERVKNNWLPTLRPLWAKEKTDDLRQYARELVESGALLSALPVYADSDVPRPLLDYWRGVARELFASAAALAGTELAGAIQKVSLLTDRFPVNLAGDRATALTPEELQGAEFDRNLRLAIEALAPERATNPGQTLSGLKDEQLQASLARLLGMAQAVAGDGLTLDRRESARLRLSVLRFLATRPAARMAVATKAQLQEARIEGQQANVFRTWAPKGSAEEQPTAIGDTANALVIDAAAVSGRMVLEFKAGGPVSQATYPGAGMGERWGLFDLLASGNARPVPSTDPNAVRYVVNVAVSAGTATVPWPMMVELRPNKEAASWPTLEQWRTGKR